MGTDALLEGSFQPTPHILSSAADSKYVYVETFERVDNKLCNRIIFKILLCLFGSWSWFERVIIIID